MRAGLNVLVLIFLIAGIQGCGGDSSTGNDEPPPLPVAIPSALVLENLELIRNLEGSRRSDTFLTSVIGDGIGLNGRPLTGNAWSYVFAKKDPITLYTWYVFADGHIAESQPFPIGGGGPPISGLDISTHIKINSDRAIDIARKNGANAYLKKYPDALIQLKYTFIYEFPTCTMRIEQPGSLCPILITIQSETGEVLQKDLQCIE